MMVEVVLDAILDTIKLIPFLWLTYLLLAYMEHRTGSRIQGIIQKAGKMGPVWGSLLGIIPQCGFSAAAANLYAAGLLPLGTLLAIFLATSDEMLPILIAGEVSFSQIVVILGWKLLLAIVVGFGVGMFCKERSRSSYRTKPLCGMENCHCDSGLVRSAFRHTIQISIFIFLITVMLNLAMLWVGEVQIAALLRHRTVLGPVVAGLIGMIPNCASSVLLTTLYVEGILSFGTMMAGLFAGSGVGILVLFRMNKDRKETIKIAGLIYAISILAGILMEWTGVGNW